MKLPYIWEHNGNDSLVYVENHVGAYVRGASLEEALKKLPQELASYEKWCGSMGGIEIPISMEPELVMDKVSDLNICDADSDVLFDSEREPLTREEYETLRALALKSAEDFLRLYNAIPDKNKSVLPKRTTFYGEVPRNAFEMQEHTKSVNEYYFAEIGVDADNSGSIVECRRRGFEHLEQQEGFLNNTVFDGSYGEEWSLRKVFRRFIWHDRIHAKAMYRMAKRTFPEAVIPDYFCLERDKAEKR